MQIQILKQSGEKQAPTTLTKGTLIPAQGSAVLATPGTGVGSSEEGRASTKLTQGLATFCPPWKATALSLLDFAKLSSAHKGIYEEVVAHW